MKYHSVAELRSELIHMVEAISNLRERDMYGIIEKIRQYCGESRYDPAFFSRQKLKATPHKKCQERQDVI